MFTLFMNILVNCKACAVQQSAYLQALDDYLDTDEAGNTRVDSDNKPLHLRRVFAIYCDDIAAGANSIPELYTKSGFGEGVFSVKVSTNLVGYIDGVVINVGHSDEAKLLNSS